jgi:predicted RNA-binding protein YlqC (UPF0109 family)
VDQTVAARQQRRTEETPQEISQIIERLLKELIDDDETCTVTFTQAGSLILIEVVPGSPRAAGQLIGRSGRTISALRTLATAVCAKYGWRAQLEIVA